MGLMADLGSAPVGVDTAIFIYFIEEHPQFLPLVEPLFREVNEGRKELVTSALTLLEVLVVPYRSGDDLLAGRYEALLTQSRGVRVAEISRDHLRAAAQLRAQRESRRLMLSSLWRHWQPAAQLFSRMIATSRAYAVSVSCNCLPTLGDPARAQLPFHPQPRPPSVPPGPHPGFESPRAYHLQPSRLSKFF
jgi:hypothetical protein